jgi:hypothetical protein
MVHTATTRHRGWIFAAAAAALVVALVATGGCGGKGDGGKAEGKVEGKEEGLLKLTMVELAKRCRADRVAVERDLVGKQVELAGRIRDVKGLHFALWTDLPGDEQFTLQAFFTVREEDKAAAAKYKPGDLVIVRGVLAMQEGSFSVRDAVLIAK